MELTSVFEVFGTIAFAFSGAFVAIENRLDMFGIVCSAMATATGGGMIRDLILGNTPPLLFRSPVYVVLAVLIAFLTAVIYIPLVKSSWKHRIFAIIDILDAIGLAVFTVVGMETAISSGYGTNMFLVCFVGVVSAVGGGVLRDLFVNRRPVIMQKEIYATAALIGSVVYYVARSVLPDEAAAMAAMLLIFIIRVWSQRHHINLPFAEESNETCK